MFLHVQRDPLKAQPLGTCREVPHLWALYTHLFTDLSQSVLKRRCRWREWPQKLHPVPRLWSIHPQQSIFPVLYKGSSKNCSPFPSTLQCTEHRHRHYWQLGGWGRNALPLSIFNCWRLYSCSLGNKYFTTFLSHSQHASAFGLLMGI